jgi:hypothetical protein
MVDISAIPRWLDSNEIRSCSEKPGIDIKLPVGHMILPFDIIKNINFDVFDKKGVSGWRYR